MSSNKNFLVILILTIFLPVLNIFSAVVSFSPGSLERVPAQNLVITINFDQAVVPTAVVSGKSLLITGNWAGVLKGDVTYSNGNKTLTFAVSSSVSAGEVISVNLSNQIPAANGGKRFWEFRTSTGRVSNFNLTNVKTINVFQNAQERGRLRTYGSFTGDLNQDGWHDLTVINEDISDARIYMSDKQGGFIDNPSFVPITNPTTQNPTPSTNEGADYNLDGFLDLAVGQIGGSALSILLGDGTGKLTEHGVYLVSAPSPTSKGTRGICALDLNGDNYYDLVAANRVGNNISILTNNGDGTFATARPLEGGVTAETACASGDFNEDGWEDIAIGGYGNNSDGTDGKISILLSDGQGNLTLVPTSVQNSNTPWMIVTGDFNNDGHLDVVSDNNRTREFSYLQGDGAGNLAAAQSYPVARHQQGFLGPLAIDVGDLDGDGALDVLTSNYGSADFTLYMGVGDGTFGNRTELITTIAGSDAVLHDRDGDGDLDFTGVDEEADVILLFENQGTLMGVPTKKLIPSDIFESFYFNGKEKGFVYQLKANEQASFELLDAKGKIIKTLELTQQYGDQSISLQDQASSGIHFYRLVSGGKSFSNKLVLLN